MRAQRSRPAAGVAQQKTGQNPVGTAGRGTDRRACLTPFRPVKNAALSVCIQPPPTPASFARPHRSGRFLPYWHSAWSKHSLELRMPFAHLERMSLTWHRFSTGHAATRGARLLVLLSRKPKAPRRPMPMPGYSAQTIAANLTCRSWWNCDCSVPMMHARRCGDGHRSIAARRCAARPG